MTIGHLIQSASSRPRRKNINRLDVELLLSRVLCCERMYLYTHWNSKMNRKQIRQFYSLFKLRQTGMPMAYIRQKKEFDGSQQRAQQGPKSQTGKAPKNQRNKICQRCNNRKTELEWSMCIPCMQEAIEKLEIQEVSDLNNIISAGKD